MPVALSVIIPVRNGALDLPGQLGALARQEFDRGWEVIVADNGSTDGTADCVESFRGRVPGLRLVDASEMGSTAFALNTGVEAAQGELLLFLDADDEVASGYIAAMAAALEPHRFVASRVESESLNPEWVRKSRPASQADGIGDAFGLLPAAGGCSLGMRRDVFDRLKGFDVGFPICQDVDFCWRAQLAGEELVFVPEALLHYRYRDSFKGIFRQARGYGRSGPLLYARYRDKGMPRRSARSVLRFWGALLPRLLRIRSRADLGAWIFLLGYRTGLIDGCVRARVWYI